LNQDLTDITLVVDRSGSMQTIRSDAEGGINALVDDQRRQPGEARITIVQFDTDVDVVCTGLKPGDVPPYHLVPRGGTALLDAVGTAIVATGERLAAMREAERPALVLFVVVTDGKENSSKEYTKARIQEMVRHQTHVYSWQFTFLGADADAFDDARGMGMSASGSARYAKHKIGHAFRGTSSKLSRMRGQAARGEAVQNAFTDAEREHMG